MRYSDLGLWNVWKLYAEVSTKGSLQTQLPLGEDSHWWKHSPHILVICAEYLHRERGKCLVSCFYKWERVPLHHRSSFISFCCFGDWCSFPVSANFYHTTIQKPRKFVLLSFLDCFFSPRNKDCPLVLSGPAVWADTHSCSTSVTEPQGYTAAVAAPPWAEGLAFCWERWRSP